MKFEARYLEENVNVSRRDYGREFLKLLVALLVIIFVTYILLGFIAEQIALHLPLSMEKALGAAFSHQIDEKIYPETRAYAQRVLDRIVEVSKDIPPFAYRVDIMDEKSVNAVALPAGRIVLFRGLVEKLDSEEALAMVLAHELGHYAHRDHLRGLGRRLVLMAIGVILGVDSNTPGFLMPSVEMLELKFSRKAERAADYFALEAVFKAYGRVGEALKLYDILATDEPPSFRFILFSTHPDTRQRKDNLKVLIRDRHYIQGPKIPLPGDGRLPFSGERKIERQK